MQHQTNHGIDTLVHDVTDPFFNYLIFFLHMFITCYLTLLLYFAIRPSSEGSICIFAFFLDWNIIALLTSPLMNRSKNFFKHPARLIFGIFLMMIFMILIIYFSQDNIVLTVVQGIQKYKPIFIRPFWS